MTEDGASNTVNGRILVTDVDEDDDAADLATNFTFVAASATQVDGTVAEDNVVTSNAGVQGDEFQSNTDKANYSVTGNFGTLQINTDGTWTYTVDNDDERVQALEAGDTLSERFALRVHDGAALSATRFITVTIEGANEPAQAPSFLGTPPGSDGCRDRGGRHRDRRRRFPPARRRQQRSGC